jgi:DNA-binding NtrC family response regulator
VDDEELVKELSARILTKHGYTVPQAEDGREALHLFKKNRSKISLVILDLIMPEVGGMECLKELLEIDPTANVLVATGYSSDPSVKERMNSLITGNSTPSLWSGWQSSLRPCETNLTEGILWA